MSDEKIVLIVDDTESIRVELEKEFTAAGWKVVTASDGDEVFRMFTAYMPSVVLLDIQMPRIDGIEVCRLLKGHPEWKKSLIFVMSATLSNHDRQVLNKIGADAVLSKPINIPEVLRELNARLGAS
ncbi:response regulator transcription factor [Myxococcota bacterium]|nr:response regulator transcription factor [Myxococcota bacterium]